MALPLANIDHTLFYVLGITLVCSAVCLAVVGLRFESFPPNRLALAAVVVWFVGLVGGTTTFAVLNARDEQHKQEAEEAAAAKTAPTSTTPSTTSTSTTSTSTTTTSTSTAPTSTSTTSTSAAGGGSTVKISADPSGQLAFQQKAVTASKPGPVKIDFTNDSPVGHDVHVADRSGKDLGGTQVITGTSTSATVNLKPGKYTFFCSVPGHEQAGMKGTLTVK
jgi:plastocyanin